MMITAQVCNIYASGTTSELMSGNLPCSQKLKRKKWFEDRTLKWRLRMLSKLLFILDYFIWKLNYKTQQETDCKAENLTPQTHGQADSRKE